MMRRAIAVAVAVSTAACGGSPTKPGSTSSSSSTSTSAVTSQSTTVSTTITTTSSTTTVPGLLAVIDAPSGSCAVLTNCAFSGFRSTGAVSFEWTFAENVPSVTFTSTLVAPTIQFPKETVPKLSQGNITVRLRVRNAAGQTAETTVAVTVTRGNIN